MADRSARALKENQPPSDSQNGKKQVDADSPERGLPVKNTFIHFGSPSRTPVGNRALATPKTVPPHFAPEVSNVSSSDAPISCWRTVKIMETSDLIAPLRLFDFLPSPQVAKQTAPAPLPSGQGVSAAAPGAPAPSGAALQAETITAMAAFHAVHAFFSAMPSGAMPPLPQVGGYQAQPQYNMWPAETSQPDMSGPMVGPMPEMAVPMPEGSGSFDDWSAWTWPQGETDNYLGMAPQQDSWDLERYDEA